MRTNENRFSPAFDRSKTGAGISMRKRFLSGLLALCMALTLLPGITLPAAAAAATTGEDVFSALGLDTETTPTGYDENTTSNPYGRDNVTVNPVYEIANITQAGAGAVLGSDGSGLLGTIDEFFGSEQKAVSGGNFANVKAQQTVAGDFDGDGRDDEIASITVRGSTTNSGQVGMFLAIADTNSSGDLQFGDSKQVLRDLDADGFGNNRYDKSDDTKYLNYTAITAGDFDGDGVDEIAVYIPESVNGMQPKVQVFKREQLDPTKSITASDVWIATYNYELPSLAGYMMPNNVSLLAADLNRDGVDDLAVAFGIYGYQGMSGAIKWEELTLDAQMSVLFGDRGGRMLLTSQTFSLMQDGQPLVRVGLALADLDGDGASELILGGQPKSDFYRKNNIYTYTKGNDQRVLQMYTFDGTQLSILLGQTIDVNEKDDNGNVVSGEKYYSDPDRPANMAAVRFGGEGTTPYLYMDSVLYSYGASGFTIEEELADENGILKNGSNRYFEYDVAAARTLTDGREILVLYREINTVGYQSTYIYQDDSGTLVAGRTSTAAAGSSVCMPDVDQDTSVIHYTGKQYLIYSDPKVLAVLASAPYFADLADGDYPGDCETSYTSTEGDSDNTGSDAYSNSLIVAGFFSWETEVTVLEIETTHSFTWTHESTWSREYSITYGTNAGQDTVALYSIPIQVYEYEYYVPETGEWESMQINIPYAPCTSTLPLTRYQRIAANYDDLPDLSGVFDHTYGDPSTYPQSVAGLNELIVYKGDWSRVGYGEGVGYGQQSQEISMGTEEIDSFTYESELTAKFGGKVAGITAGGGLGWGHSEDNITSITTEGSTYTGNVTDLPSWAEAYGYGFSWKLYTYKHRVAGEEFPVVGYIVRDAYAPPNLPDDFAQDYSATTVDSIGLTWSYTGAIAGFQIYRYYDFPEGGGSYEVGGFIPSSAYTSLIQNPGGEATRVYTFIDSGLEPYTAYDYQIQAIGSTQPTHSVLSQTPLTARTKSTYGYPDISVSANELMIYPDKDNSSISVNIENLTDYAQTPKFQWQRQDGALWKDIDGKTGTKLTFSAPGESDRGVYRCRVNTLYDGMALTAYSESVTVDYAKRTAAATDIDLTYGASARDVTFSTTVTNMSTGSSAIPGGSVVFELMGQNFTKTVTVLLSEQGVASCTLRLPANKAFTVSAFYGGDRIFRTTSCSEKMFSTGDSGHIIEMPDTLAYGDVISPKVYEVNREAVTDVTADATFTATGSSTPAVAGKTIELRGIGSISVSASVDGTIVATTDKTVEKRRLVIGLNTPDEIETQRFEAYSWYDSDQFIAVDGTSLAPWDKFGTPIGVTEKPSTNYFPTEDGGRYLRGVVRLISDVGTDLQFNLVVNGYFYLGQTLPGKVGNKDQTLYGGIYQLFPYVVGTFDTTCDYFNCFDFLPKEDDPDTWITLGGSGFDASTFDEAYEYYSWSVQPKPLIVTGTTYEAECSVKSGSEGYGSITRISPDDGRSSFASGTTLIYTATPLTGYKVKNWYVNGVAQNSAGSSFSVVSKSLPTLVEVEFERTKLSVEFSVSPAASGRVYNQSNPNMPSGAEAQYNAEFTFVAQPADGYHFVEWQYVILGEGVTQPEGEVNADGLHTLTIRVTNSVRVYAVMQRDSYTLTLSDCLQAVYLYDTDNDATTPDEYVSVTGTVSIPGDTELTVKPLPGYELASDPQWSIEGGKWKDESERTFCITSDTSISANIERQSYTVTIEEPANGAVDVVCGGEPGLPTGEIPGGTALVLTAKANRGYLFSGWKINDAENLVPGTTLRVTALAEDMRIEAVFEEHSTTHICTVDSFTKGKLYYAIDAGEQVEIDASKETQILLYPGEDIVFIAVPDENYMLFSWTQDNVANQTSDKTWTISDVDKDHTLCVSFAATYYLNLTVAAPSQGGALEVMADGEPATGTRSYGVGTKIVCEAKPSSGYAVSAWKINDQGSDTAGKSGVYSFTLESNTKISVEFERDSNTLYNVSAGSTTNGTLSYTVSTGRYGGRAAAGDTVTVTAQPDANCFLEELFAVYSDGEEKKDNVDGSFTMPAADVTLQPTFTEIALERIRVNSITHKTVYTVDDILDVSGLTILAEKNDGTSETVNVSSNMVSNFNSAAAAESQTLTITYEGKTTTYAIIIRTADVPQPTGYQLTVELNGGNGATVSGEYAAGEQIFIHAGSKTNYTFSGWTSTAGGEFANTGLNSTTFTMPANSTTITAHWTPNSTGGGGGSGGSASVDPSIFRPETSGDTTTVTAAVTPSTNGTASSVTVSAATANRAVNSAIEAAEKDNTVPVVEIKVSTPARAESIEVTMPGAALETLSENEDAQLVITSGVADVTIDADALAAIAEQVGSDITISVTPVAIDELNSNQRESVGDASVFDVTVRSGNTVISDPGGGRISVTVPYEPTEGQNAEGLVVYYLDDNGDLYACETDYNAATRMLTFHTDHLSKYVVMSARVNPFTDVLTGNYFYDAVLWAAEREITTGATATTFLPAKDCTRGQIVTFLWRAYGSPEPATTESFFADVNESDYYYKAVLWAAEQGVATGIGDDAFSPDVTCTRAQAVTFLWRAAGSPELATEENPFTDVTESDYYYKAVLWAAEQGITAGTGGGFFSPDENCARGQIVTMLYRALDEQGPA